MVWLIITHLSTLFYVSSTRGGGQQFPRINRVCKDTIAALCVRSVFAGCGIVLGGNHKGATGHLAFFISGPWHHRLSGFSVSPTCAHGAAVGTAAERVCFITHPSAKSRSPSNSLVVTSDGHLRIKPVGVFIFVCTLALACGPFPTHRDWLTAWTVYGRFSLWVTTCGGFHVYLILCGMRDLFVTQ